MAANLQDMQAQDDAYAKQVADQQAAQKTQEALQPQGQDQQQSFLSKFMSATGRVTTDTLDWAVNSADAINKFRDRAAHDIGAGVVTGATNIADAVGSAVSASGKGLAAAADPEHAQDAEEGSLPTSPIWDHAKNAILDFRDAIAVKDPTLSDKLIQGAAQLAVPFTGYSRALSGVHGFANLVAANALTDATALGPHDPRMADLISLGRKTEGKLGEALRTLAPDGSALNEYINYLAAPREQETEAAGRFKNVLDGFGSNLVATPLLHAAASTIKYGTQGLRYLADKGIGSTGELSSVSEGYQPQNMNLSKEERALERERVATLRDREMGVGQDVVPEKIPRRAAEVEGEAARRDRADMSPAAAALEAPSEMASRAVGIHANDGYLTDLGMKLSAVNEGAAPLKLHDVLTDMSQKLSDAEPAGAFYKELAGRLASKNLTATITDTSPKLGNNLAFGQPGPNTRGMYHLGSDQIGLFPGAFKSNVAMAHAVTHEAVHAATLDALKDSSTGLRSQIESLRQDAAKAAPTAYGVKNEAEFVAEAESNKAFQDKLKATKGMGGKSLWDEYKAIIGGVLGLSGAALASPHWDDVLTTKEKTGA